MYDKKKATTKKAFKVNAQKDLFVLVQIVAMENSKFPWSICRRGVGSNSILCIECNSWVHKKCDKIQKCFSKAVDFVCRQCSGSTNNGEND